MSVCLLFRLGFRRLSNTCTLLTRLERSVRERGYPPSRLGTSICVSLSLASACSHSLRDPERQAVTWRESCAAIARLRNSHAFFRSRRLPTAPTVRFTDVLRQYTEELFFEYFRNMHSCSQWTCPIRDSYFSFETMRFTVASESLRNQLFFFSLSFHWM